MPSASTGPRTLSQSQIYTIALMTGMPKPRIMTAIAMAESSGNTRAHNAQPPDNSYGLWQINMLGDMGPERRKQFGISSNEQLYNPFINAFAAKKILASQGLGAWSTYTNGSYLKYMDKAVTSDQKAVTQATQADFDWKDPFGVWPEWMDPYLKGPLDEWFGSEETDEFGIPGQAQAEDLEAIATGMLGIAEAGQKAGVWLSQTKNWVRVAYVAGGGLIALLAILSIARPAVTKVVPQVKAVGTVAKKIGKVKK